MALTPLAGAVKQTPGFFYLRTGSDLFDPIAFFTAIEGAYRRTLRPVARRASPLAKKSAVMACQLWANPALS
jgi:hypothetical protein